MAIFTPQQYAAFVLAAIVCTFAPGPDNLSVLSLGISRGKRAGIGFGLGCALGCLTHTTWATIGVAALIAASVPAFTGLKLAGACYLFYLGVKALRSNGAKLDVEQSATPSTDTEPLTRYLGRGFLANALNPKVALFFLAFLPQFVNRAGRINVQMALLGITFAVVSGLIFSGLGYFSGHVGQWLRKREGAAMWLDRLTGCLFISLGIKLALFQRGH